MFYLGSIHLLLCTSSWYKGSLSSWLGFEQSRLIYKGFVFLVSSFAHLHLRGKRVLFLQGEENFRKTLHVAFSTWCFEENCSKDFCFHLFLVGVLIAIYCKLLVFQFFFYSVGFWLLFLFSLVLSLFGGFRNVIWRFSIILGYFLWLKS